MKAAVVYYSRYGHTTKVAEALAQELEAETRRIEETRKRGFIGMGRGSVTDARFEIEPMDLDLSGYDAVVLCTPIWAGTLAANISSRLSAIDSPIFLKNIGIKKQIHLYAMTLGVILADSVTFSTYVYLKDSY